MADARRMHGGCMICDDGDVSASKSDEHTRAAIMSPQGAINAESSEWSVDTTRPNTQITASSLKQDALLSYISLRSMAWTPLTATPQLPPPPSPCTCTTCLLGSPAAFLMDTVEFLLPLVESMRIVAPCPVELASLEAVA